MKGLRPKLASCALATVLGVSSVGLPSMAAAQEGRFFEQNPPDKSTRMLADTFLVRPVMLAGTIIGTAAFVVSLPFSAAGGNTGEAWEQLVVAPASYTFGTPLGDLPE